MAGHPTLCSSATGIDALEEVRDALPVGVCVDTARLRSAAGPARLVVDERAVARAAAARRRLPFATTPRNVMLYLSAGMPARGGVADHLADVVDLAIAVRALAQHDVGILERG